ncbi:DUF6893 family small protein [Streptomyces sp. NBC_01190]
MKVLGIISTALAAVGAVTALVVGVMSIPDIRRYLRMRSM